jgi:hypothetical protein
MSWRIAAARGDVPASAACGGRTAARHVSIAEALSFALALGVSPAALFLPLGITELDPDVQLTKRSRSDAWAVFGWICGHQSLTSIDAAGPYREMFRADREGRAARASRPGEVSLQEQWEREEDTFYREQSPRYRETEPRQRIAMTSEQLEALGIEVDLGQTTPKRKPRTQAPRRR